MKQAIVFLLLLFGIAETYSQEAPNDYDDAIKLIEVWLKAQKDYKNMPSIMGMVVQDQEVIWSGAFGQSNVESGQMSSTNTVCSICSISKTFTAIAVMKLVDEGKVGLDEEVENILPNFTVKQKFPENGAVTVRSLLAHNSGLPRDSGHWYWSAPNFPFPTKEALFSKLPALETNEPVGKKHDYSNLGYALLGQIIEKVSGMPYEEYLKTNIFDPLDMKDSYGEMPKSLVGKQHAVGYSAINRNGKRKRVNTYQTRAMKPAAGISTTIDDLVKYASWQFRLLDSNASEIVKPSTLKSMYDVHSTGNNGRLKRGFGFELYMDEDNKQWAMHGGICPGYVSYLKMDLSNKMAYAILINANGEKALRYVNGIINILKKVREPGETVNEVSNLLDYEGFYSLNPWNSEYYFTKWGDGLVAFYLPTESIKYSMYLYKYVSKDRFQLINEDGQLGDELQFFRNADGRVVQVKNEGNYHQRLEH